MGIDLSDAKFVIKSKHVEVPTQWEHDLRHRNMQGDWRDLGSLTWGPEGARLTVTELPLGGEHLRQDRTLETDQKLLR